MKGGGVDSVAPFAHLGRRQAHTRNRAFRRRQTDEGGQDGPDLPDPSRWRAPSYAAGVTPAEVAADISPSLAKKAISATVNGAHWDLQWPIEADAEIAIHTMKDEAQALELIRHDLAHVMARAVQEIWPEVKVTIGPVIENGWYYDFDREEPFTPEDLGQIEAKMREIINRRDPVTTEIWDRDRAVKYYEANNEPYKVELVGMIPGAADPHVLARPLAGPLPRPAPAAHRPACPPTRSS
jgi:hypothetical protein